MATKKPAKEEVEKVILSISPIEEVFGNGDLNAIKDKINEIIAFITKE